jgi:hypothetical protein
MGWPSMPAPVGSASVGAAITLLSGLVDVTPNLVGARWYGLPSTWIRRLVIAPQYNPLEGRLGGPG